MVIIELLFSLKKLVFIEIEFRLSILVKVFVIFFLCWFCGVIYFFCCIGLGSVCILSLLLIVSGKLSMCIYMLGII